MPDIEKRADRIQANLSKQMKAEIKNEQALISFRTVSGPTGVPDSLHETDYAVFLNEQHIPFVRSVPYLIIGDYPSSAICLIHVSVITGKMLELLACLNTILVPRKCSYSIPESSKTHKMILDGSLGYDQIGKVLTFYPETPDSAVSLAQQLIEATSLFVGPEVPACAHLGNCVYTPIINNAPWDLVSALNINQKSNWPFGRNRIKSPLNHSQWISGKYFKVTSLKNDAKGNVYKGLNFSKWTNIRWCVIKQGKKHQCVDDQGRDARDRLRWQFKVQSAISDLISVPRVIDLIEVNGDAYFIMEFIEGESFNDVISSVQEGIKWHAMCQFAQITLLNLLLKLIETIAGLHQLGFLHRDLSPVNFIVTPEGKLVAIDLELCYNIIDRSPNPKFTLGTPGYMSPEQYAGKEPFVEDDIFGIGGLVLRTFTGVSPTKFFVGNTEGLINDICFFSKNRPIATLIASCFQSDKTLRPSLQTIAGKLGFYQALVLTGRHLDNEIDEAIDAVRLHNLISKGLVAFKQQLLSTGDEWRLNAQTGVTAGNHRGDGYAGFSEGGLGILFTITKAHDAGYPISNFDDQFFSNFYRVKDHFEQEITNHNPGLYNGSAGFSVVLCEMITSNLLEKNAEHIRLIQQSLGRPCISFNLSDGLAGQGIAMIKCAALLDMPILAAAVSGFADLIVKRQNRNGSWGLKGYDVNRVASNSTGLLNGIAGIVYFLLIYGDRYQNDAATAAADKGLNWLLSKRIQFNGTWKWPVTPSDKLINPWLENGFSGIAYVFIRAFQLSNEERFKSAAVEALLSHPKEITSNYLSQAHGICGLGEIYLEAFQVFGDPEWLERATIIAAFLTHAATLSEGGGIQWLDGSDTTPLSGFMNGQAGVLHFLLRLENPDKINFPLISL